MSTTDVSGHSQHHILAEMSGQIYSIRYLESNCVFIYNCTEYHTIQSLILLIILKSNLFSVEKEYPYLSKLL